METKEQHPGTKESKLPRTRRVRRAKTLRILEQDIDKRLYHSLAKREYLAVDTETDGLNWLSDKLRLVQISTSDARCYVIREPDAHSRWLQALLLHAYSTKIFHHALFDLRFIKRWMAIDVMGKVECTKTLHKLIYPGIKAGLAHLVKSRYGISLPYLGTYNWDGKLSAKQKEYIVGDVLYLHALMRDLKKEATHGQLARYKMIMRTIRNKATLEVEGYEDVLDYPIGDREHLENVRAIWAIMRHRAGPLTELTNP